MNESLVEQRLTALERAVDELRRRAALDASDGNWLQRITGSIADKELFLEALEEGRKFRHADRPADDSDEQP